MMAMESPLPGGNRYLSVGLSVYSGTALAGFTAEEVEESEGAEKGRRYNMTLAQAIEIKLQWRKDNYPPPLSDEMNADMLSIEAIRRIAYLRKDMDCPHWMTLPGETEE